MIGCKNYKYLNKTYYKTLTKIAFLMLSKSLSQQVNNTSCCPLFDRLTIVLLLSKHLLYIDQKINRNST